MHHTSLKITPPTHTHTPSPSHRFSLHASTRVIHPYKNINAIYLKRGVQWQQMNKLAKFIHERAWINGWRQQARPNKGYQTLVRGRKKVHSVKLQSMRPPPISKINLQQITAAEHGSTRRQRDEFPASRMIALSNSIASANANRQLATVLPSLDGAGKHWGMRGGGEERRKGSRKGKGKRSRKRKS